MTSVTDFQSTSLRPAKITLQTVALIGAVAAVRIAVLHANVTELHFDEAQYWAWSREPAFGYYSKPPLIAWLIAASTSLCGDSEFCVRLPSVVLHAATAFAVFVLARQLYGQRTGFWAAAVYATLPGVSLSSGIITTDVPLLLFWAVAFSAFVDLLDNETWASSILLGLALGAGLNAKYAMAYFVVCAAVYFAAVPDHRALLRRPHLWAALIIAAAMMAPNLLWNADHKFATFTHTAGNAKWSGSLMHPAKAVEFAAVQFGVAGPIVFGTALAILWRARAQLGSLPHASKLLLAFSAPIFLIVTLQAFASRAHGNWAAPAFIAVVVLATAHLLRRENERWLQASFAINTVIAVTLAVVTAFVAELHIPGRLDPFQKLSGARIEATAVANELNRARAAGEPYAAILTADREKTASLIYYGRADATPVVAWADGGSPRDHFELTRSYQKTRPDPVLFVTNQPLPGSIKRAFGSIANVSGLPGAHAAAEVAAGMPFQFYRLSDPRTEP